MDSESEKRPEAWRERREAVNSKTEETDGEREGRTGGEETGEEGRTKTKDEEEGVYFQRQVNRTVHIMAKRETQRGY